MSFFNEIPTMGRESLRDLKKGIDLGVYDHIDYSKYHEDYCGIKITDTPLT